MTFTDGAIVRAAENVTEEIDGVGVNLPAGDYRAVPLPGGAEPGEGRLVLLASGHEGAHPMAEETLRTLLDDDAHAVEIVA